MITDRQQSFVHARYDNLCQRRNTGCHITSNQLEQVLTTKELNRLLKDTNHPDVYCTVCDNCHRTDLTPGTPS